MAHVTYKIVRHEDGWAYTVDGVFSESFPDARAGAQGRAPRRARAAGARADRDHRVRGRERQVAHRARARRDRPDTDVEDSA